MGKEKVETQQYSKEAFVEAVADGKEGLILQVILEDEKSYTKDEVTKLVKSWKSKEAN